MNLLKMIPIQPESGGTETSVLAEGIPEELGHEWRVLHSFEIPRSEISYRCYST